VFARIEDAVEEFRRGRMVIIVDAEDRENEGDLACAAESITPDIVNFMIREGRGLVCLPMAPGRLDELGLPLMVVKNTARFGTAFCVSIDAKEGVTTGISATDRAVTILAAADPRAKPEDFVRPGHVFPLRAARDGVLSREGQTEAAVDLTRLAGLQPAGVICEILKEDGTMARVPDLKIFARRHGLAMITIAALIEHRLRSRRTIPLTPLQMLSTP
jgi:3,4-dihydroxy 2-butanone 4-phosphate synthase/GTP cyclohydrolase II